MSIAEEKCWTNSALKEKDPWGTDCMEGKDCWIEGYIEGVRDVFSSLHALLPEDNALLPVLADHLGLNAVACKDVRVVCAEKWEGKAFRCEQISVPLPRK